MPSFPALLTLVFQSSHAKTIAVDKIAEWRNPTQETLSVRRLYFPQQKSLAFKLCNSTEATLLNKCNSTSFMWRPSVFSYAYFSFNNGSLKARLEAEQLANAGVSQLHHRPLAGLSCPLRPAYHWSFHSHRSNSPSPAPTANPPATTIPSMLPDIGEDVHRWTV
uniref:Uncharacterized protein n=1 Tax=Nelumbo nucifera TaxID=4432 RepID=A0A822XD92_NELNU|nr:TPA_asm: hypothetical protein HUJ06_020867 [Nelumbo nucifera]